MTELPKYTGVLALTALVACVESRAEPPNWTVWVEDGKTDTVVLDHPECRELSGRYLQLLIAITPWNVTDEPDRDGAPTETSPFQFNQMQVTSIGVWGPYEILDVTNSDIKHKSIVLKDRDSLYRVLYTQFHWSTAGVDDLPKLHVVEGQHVLSYRTRIPGTGHYFIEKHFVYDPEHLRPEIIETDEISTAIDNALPDGFDVRKGGGLDFKAMNYSSAVWKNDDGNCCPTGGRITMRLALNKNRLEVKEVTYDPEYEWD